MCEESLRLTFARTKRFFLINIITVIYNERISVLLNECIYLFSCNNYHYIFCLCDV